MIYKTGDTVYEIKNKSIITHIIKEWKFVTWIQALLIDEKWRDSRDFYETLEDAEHHLKAERGFRP